MLSYDGIKEEIKRGSIYVDNSGQNVGANSISVTLGDTIKVYSTNLLNVEKMAMAREIKLKEDGTILKPGELYIGRTFEFTKTYGFVPILGTIDELAVLGMEAHVTAGFGDNGFEGTWTLEIVCTNPTVVYPNMLIGYLSYYPLIGNGDGLYRGKYFKQIDATVSRLSEEYDKGKVKKYVNK